MTACHCAKYNAEVKSSTFKETVSNFLTSLLYSDYGQQQQQESVVEKTSYFMQNQNGF